MQRYILYFILIFVYAGSLIAAEPAYIQVTSQPRDTVAGNIVAGYPEVTVFDTSDNPVDTAGIEITVTLNHHDFRQTSTDTVATDTNGKATFSNLVIDTAATDYRLIFRSDTFSNDTSDLFTITASASDTLIIFRQPGDTIQGYPIPGPPTVILSDTFGNPVDSVETSVTVNQDTVSGIDTVITNNSGKAVFDSLFIDSTGIGYNLIFGTNNSEAPGVENDTSDAFRIYEEQATITITNQPDTSVVDFPVEGINVIDGPAVLVEDMSGTPLQGVNISVRLKGGTWDSASVDTVSTNSSGYAVFDSLITTSTGSSYQLVFSTGTPQVANATSDTFEVVASTGTMKMDQQPQESVEDWPVEGLPAVYLEEAGTPLDSVAITAHLNKNGFTPESDLTVTTNDSGVAVFDSLIISSIDTGYQIVFEASRSGVASLISDTFDVVEELGKLTIQQQPGLTIAGERIQEFPSVKLEDTTGSPFGSPVNIYAYINKNTFTTNSDTLELATSANGGIATFDSLIIDQPDSAYQIRFSTNTSGIADVYTGRFEVIPVAGTMTIDPQPSESIEGSLLNGPPTVTIHDTLSNPLPGITVEASPNQNSFDTASITTRMTDASGVASFDSLIINDTASDYTISFNVADSTGIADQISDTFAVVKETGSFTIQNQPDLTIAGDTVNGPPSVLLEDTTGSPLKNILINVTLNGGSFAGGDTTVMTNDSGIAVFDDLIIDSVDIGYSLTFFTSVSGIAAETSDSFDIIPVAGTMLISPQPSESIKGYPVSGPPTVTLLDTVNDPMPGITVEALLSKNDFDTASITTLTTDTNGLACFDSLIINETAFDYTIFFRVDDTTGVISQRSDSFAVVEEVGILTVQTQPDLTVAEEFVNGPPSVLLEDTLGNPVSNAKIHVSLDHGSLSGDTIVETNGSGIAVFDSLIVNQADTNYVLIFSSPASGIASKKSDTFEIAEPAGIMNISRQPLETVNGETIAGPPTVTLTDTNGNSWSGNEVDITVSVNKNGFSSGTITQTTSNGEAVFDDLVLNAIDTDYQLTFAVDTTIADTVSDSFDVVAETGTMDITRQPSETVEGDPVNGPPEVHLTDTAGNPVKNVNISASLNQNTFNGSSTLTVMTNDSGKAVFDNLIIDQDTTGYRITFSCEASGVADVVSNAFEVTDSSLAMTVSTQPQQSVAGDTIEGFPAVTVSDSAGGIAGVDITVTLNNQQFVTSSTLTETTNDSGVAVFDNLSIRTADTDYRITFNADYSGVPNAESDAFEVTHAEPDHLEMSVQPSETQAGNTINGPPEVILYDQFNNTVGGVDIEVVPNQHSFSSGSTTITTNSSGAAAFTDLVLTTAESNYQLFFTDTSGASVSSSFFAVTSTSADTVKITSQPSETVAGAAINGPPEVVVEDEYGNHVVGETVTVSEEGEYTLDDGTLQLTTNTNGKATFSDLVIDKKDLGYQLRFTVNGVFALSGYFNIIEGTIFPRFYGNTHSGFITVPDTGNTLGQIPDRIEINTQPQETVVNSEVEGYPQITVYDNIDNPVADVDVSVSIPGGFASGSDTTLSTNDNGQITFDQLVSDSVGTYQLDFTVDSFPSITAQSGSFEVVDQELFLTITTQPGDTTAGDPIAGYPEVRLKNSLGMGYAGVDITVYLNQYDFSSASSQTVTTNASGYARFDSLFIEQAAEEYQIIFDADYSGVLNVTSNTFAITHAAPSNLSIITQPGKTLKGAAIEGPPAVMLNDAYGNPVDSQTVNVAETGGYGFDGGTTSLTTNANGQVSFTDLVINTIGQYSLTFSNPYVPNAASQSFNVKSQTVANRFKGNTFSGFTMKDTNNNALGQIPDRIEVITQPGETVVSKAVTGHPKIVVYDEVNNTIAGVDVTVSVPGGFASGSDTTVSTNSDGKVTCDQLFIDTTGTYRLQFTADSFPSVTVQSQSFEVVDQELFFSVTTQPSETEAGASLEGPPAVQLTNSLGQGYEGVDVTVNLNQHDFSSAASTLTETTNASGYAVFDSLKINRAAENYQLIFDANYTGVLNVTSDPFDIVDAGPHHFENITDPGETMAGAAIEGPPAVTVVDTFGNPVSDVSVNVAETGGTAFDAGTTTDTTNDNGVVTFDDLIMDTVGEYSLTYSAPGLSDLVSASFDILSGTIADRFKGNTHSGFIMQDTADQDLGQTPDRIAIQTQPGETVVSSAIEGPPSVIVYDEVNNPMAGVTIRVNVDGFFTPASKTEIQTNADGKAVFDSLFIDSAATYTLTFEAVGYGSVAKVNSNNFDVVDQELFLSVTTQPGETEAGETLAGPPAVQLTNSLGQGYEGVDVTVYLNQHDFSSAASTHTETTNASGYAVFDSLKINRAAENYQLIFNANYTGVLNVTSDPFDIVNAGPHHFENITDPGETMAGAAIEGPPAVTVVDTFGNPVSAVPVSVAETGGYAFDAGTTTDTTNENGVVTFDDLIMDTVGEYSLTYSAPGLSDLVSASFDILSGTIADRFKGNTHSGFYMQDTTGQTLGQTPDHIEIQVQPKETVVSSAVEGAPSVVVYDAIDNPVAGVPVSVSLDGFFTSSSVTQVQTNANGEAVFDSLYIDSEDTYTLTFEAVGYSDVDAVNSQSFDVVNRTLNASIITQPGESVAGHPIAGPPAVKLENELGQGFQGIDVIAYINQYGFTTGSTDTVTTDGSGVATFDNLVLEQAAENYQILFKVVYAGVEDLTSTSFDVIADSASRIEVITQPGDGLAGAHVNGPPQSRLVDDYSNPVSGKTITVSEAGGYTIDSGTVNVSTDKNGMATFDNLILNTAGNYILEFSSSLPGVNDVQSDPFELRPSEIANRFKGNTHSGFITENKDSVFLQQIPASLVIFHQPEESVVGTSIQGPPSMVVYDQNGLPVANAAVTVSVVGGTPLSGTKTLQTNASGEVVFDDISIDQIGNYQLYAEVVGYSSVNVVSNAFEVVDQTLFMTIAQQPRDTVAGRIIPGYPSVMVSNDLGQPVEDVQVVVYPNQNSFSSDPEYDTVQTNTSGVAEFTQLSIQDASANYQLIFEALYPGVAGVNSNSFTITNAPPDTMLITQQPVDGEAGSAISGPPAIKIIDAYGNAVSDVTTSVSEQGGEPITGTTSLDSDSDGHAIFSSLVIDSSGTYQLVFDADTAGVMNRLTDSFNLISTGTVHRFKGNTHSGFITSELPSKELSEPPAVDTPSFTVYQDTLCQADSSVEYTATASNSDSIRYAISIQVAGQIDSATGVLDLQPGFYGSFYVRATAYGYKGPITDSMQVIVNPFNDVPVFSDPDTVVCQGDTVTYTATSVHTDTISYAVNPLEAGTMDASTGEMTFASDYDSTCYIIAIAGEPDDCGGQKRDSVEVTVNPSVEKPVFTSGDTSFCQDPPNETYTATAANATGITYSRAPADAGVIDQNTGEMDWAADFHGTATITARADGECHGPKDSTRTVTIHPTPNTPSISGDNNVACNAEGKTYSVNLDTGSSYSWTVPTGASITSGATGPENDSITVDFGEANGYVRVTETSQYGCVSDQGELQVSLYGCNLSADFEASDTVLCEGDSITFTDLSTGVPDTWEWHFGSGATPETATGEGPHTVTYSNQGTYTVSLIVTEVTVKDTLTLNDYITVNRRGVWNGSVSSNWFNPDNWSCGIVPDNGNPPFNVTIPASAPNYPEITSTGARVLDINIENGASLAITNGETLNVYDDWNNNGTFSTDNSTVVFRGNDSRITGSSMTTFDNIRIRAGSQLTAHSDTSFVKGTFTMDGSFAHNNGTVVFIGDEAQEIIGSSGDSLIFYNAVMNKGAASLTLQRNMHISQSLTMHAGIINSSDANILHVLHGASSNNGNDTSFVDGPVMKTGNTVYTFPTGDNNVWAPVDITAPNNASDAFKAQYFHTGHPEAGTDPCTNCDTLVKYVRDIEYWDIDRETGSANPDITLHFKDTARSNISALSDLIYVQWDGSEWVDKSLDGSVSCNASGECSITGTNFTTYNAHAPGISETITGPTVTASPSDSIVCESDSASFTVSASGTVDSYQWQISTDNGSTWSDQSNGGVYSGMTDSVMHISDAPDTLDGNMYRCVVSGSGISDTSSGATFTVNPLPDANLTAVADYDSICQGKNTLLEIDFTDGTAPFDFTYSDGSNSWNETNISTGPYQITPPVKPAWVSGKVTDYTYTIISISDSNGCSHTNVDNTNVSVMKKPNTGNTHFIPSDYNK